VVEKGRNLLYRNDGGAFVDVTDEAGVGDDGWGGGVAVGDPDGDGDPDLFVTNFGPDALYLNRGDGTFARLEAAPSIDGWSAGAVFFDADGDGDEDLYVTAYIDCTEEEVLHARPTLDWNGMKVMLGPFGLEGKANRYFENSSPGPGGAPTFRDSTAAAGLVDEGLYYSFGVAALDVEGDGDPDLYVANDSNPNYLYTNDGGGHFQETGLWTGASLDEGGNAQAGMGLATGDVDGDGRVDLFVTNFEQDASTLYHNLGDGLFSDVTAGLGIKEVTFQPLSWGTALADLDLDGDLDLFIANGHIYPQADRAEGSSFAQANLLLENLGSRFQDVSARSGPGLEARGSSRGLAVGDLEGDGDLDLAISNVDAPPHLLRNDSPRRGAWLRVDAPGARRLEVMAGKRRLARDRVVGGSYLSVSDPVFHLGLGEGAASLDLEVRWADGTRIRYRGVPADRTLVLGR
jgi:hypothetical protein